MNSCRSIFLKTIVQPEQTFESKPEFSDEKRMLEQIPKAIFPQDQRRYPRRVYTRGVGVLSKGEYQIAQSVDLGEGGLSFASDLVYPQGMKLVLSFQVPMGSFLVVRAQVVRLQKDEHGRMLHGCSFLNVKFEHKREIRTYVSARS